MVYLFDRKSIDSFINKVQNLATKDAKNIRLYKGVTKLIVKNIVRLTTSIWSAVSFKKDKYGRILQSKQRSYSLPVLDEKKTKRNLSPFINSLLAEYSVREISTLLMECLDDVKFQYMLSHNGFRLAKNIPKDKRISVADIYTFSQAMTYCFSFLPSESPVKPLSIVTGVMAPAGQDLGCTLLEQFWQTQGHAVTNLGIKVKPQVWIEAIDRDQPDFLSISCMLNSCIAYLQELLRLLSERRDSTRICLGGMAIDKFEALRLSQEYRMPIFYGVNLNSTQQNSKSNNEHELYDRETIDLPADIKNLIPEGKIACNRIHLEEIVLEGDTLWETEKLISSFNSAVIVTTTNIPGTRRDAKILIRQLLQIETFVEISNRSAFSFHYPIPCPFCLPNDCRKDGGHCMNPSYTRPLPKILHINLPKTMDNAKIKNLGLSSLILVK